MKFVWQISLFLIIFWAPLASAQVLPWTNPFYDISSLNVKINISQKGEVEVEKKFLLSVQSSDFSWTEDLPISGMEIFASNTKLKKKDLELKKEKGRLFIKAKTQSPAQAWTLRFNAPSALKPVLQPSPQDSFSLPIVSEPGVYIRNLLATLYLPTAPTQTKNLKPRIYAIHGVGRASFYLANPQTLVYEGSDLSAFSIYTIAASWPKGLIKYPFLKQISFTVKSGGFKFWVGIGAVLPLLTLLFYFYMLYKKKREEKLAPLTYLDKPPEDLPPALVGVLLRERASQREIIATILDMAQRGFIDIVKKRDEYVLGKRQGKDTLRPFEAFLYDKLFTQQEERRIKRTEFELQARAAEQLYSPKISKFYQDLYLETQNRGYFLKNPALVALRFRIFGILFFLSAILTSFLAIRYSSPPFALFGSFGQIIASFLIIKTAPLFPKRTKAGKQALSLWLSFGQYLSDKKPLGLLVSQQGLFEKYLPYAVALENEIDWAVRFSRVGYTPPSWYTAEETITLENFAGSLFYITGSLSQILYGLREPSL